MREELVHKHKISTGNLCNFSIETLGFIVYYLNVKSCQLSPGKISTEFIAERKNIIGHCKYNNLIFFENQLMKFKLSNI